MLSQDLPEPFILVRLRGFGNHVSGSILTDAECQKPWHRPLLVQEVAGVQKRLVGRSWKRIEALDCLLGRDEYAGCVDLQVLLEN